MNFIENLDHQIFFFINNTCHVRWLDALAPYYRSAFFWIPLYVFFISFIIINFGKKGVIYLLALALTVGVADTASSKIVKKTVQRIRPCHNITLKDNIKLLVRCGGGFSFTSSHATNHFAVAAFIIFTLLANPNQKPDSKTRKILRGSLWFWAGSIAFGQVYVGVHFPSDVIFGAILGFGIGYYCAWFYENWLIPRYFPSELIHLTI